MDITSFSIEVYFLKDGSFELDEVYMLISKNEEKHLREQEEFMPPNKFVSPIFGGVDINLYKVFGEILPEGF